MERIFITFLIFFNKINKMLINNLLKLNKVKYQYLIIHFNVFLKFFYFSKKIFDKKMLFLTKKMAERMGFEPKFFRKNYIWK